ncbi:MULTISPECIES: glycosyltransferase family 2 protein [Prochlorococcus]|uniref:glycosyltransferase family 2 protein n=1 Tax=Prochlorococcus TaxID=1218 RepID=UPI0005339817|nr:MULTISPECIES: glycosyltransferase family 2 protein [Prochlorococcus]KGG12074.1 Glycosyltransferase [Prochlorococcus sp. MIT 0601]
MDKNTITWVVPCFNEQEVITQAVERIDKVCESLDKYKWEIIFIDDGSIDNTRKLIKEAFTYNSRIKLIGLSRNYGHQIAVQAGINNAIGEAVIVIDADLQDPPELAASMLAKWENGFDVIYGRRIERQSESRFKKISAAIFYRLLNLLSDINIPLDAGDFRLIDKKVVQALRAMPERGRYLRGLITWSGFKQTHVDYSREKRYAGTSKYPLIKMIRFAVEGITSFSRKPLQLATLSGLFASLISIIGIIYVLYSRLMTDNWVEGWAGLALAILFSSGLQLIFIGILGEYIGRIYIESKARPLYFIDEVIEQ